MSSLKILWFNLGTMQFLEVQSRNEPCQRSFSHGSTYFMIGLPMYPKSSLEPSLLGIHFGTYQCRELLQISHRVIITNAMLNSYFRDAHGWVVCSGRQLSQFTKALSYLYWAAGYSLDYTWLTYSRTRRMLTSRKLRVSKYPWTKHVLLTTTVQLDAAISIQSTLKWKQPLLKTFRISKRFVSLWVAHI